MYSYEPGKITPPCSLPASSVEERDTKQEDEANQAEKQEELDNPNEFRPCPSQEKRSSQNIEEKKLLNDVINAEEKKKKESDVRLPEGYSSKISLSPQSLT